MSEAYIIDAIRTPIGSLGGALAPFVQTIWRLSLSKR